MPITIGNVYLVAEWYRPYSVGQDGGMANSRSSFTISNLFMNSCFNSRSYHTTVRNETVKKYYEYLIGTYFLLFDF